MSRGDFPNEYSEYDGGPKSESLPMPRELEKVCIGADACTVYEKSTQTNWTLPTVTYEVVHCYKVRREPLVSAGKRDGYLKKFNSTGHEIWSVRMGGYENDVLTSMAVDRWGNLFAVGEFLSSNITFDSKILKQMVDTRILDIMSPISFTQSSKKITKLLIVKYNSGGEFIMSSEAAACVNGKELDCFASSIDVDDMGNIYITGIFKGSITFGAMCETKTCKTVIQSSQMRKISQNRIMMDPSCMPSFDPTCKKVPMVKMQSIRSCGGKESTGNGFVCEGNVFVALGRSSLQHGPHVAA